MAFAPATAPGPARPMAQHLKIVVNGLTAEEEQAFAAEVENDHPQRSRCVVDRRPAVPGRLMIFREKNRLFAEWRVRGGHRTVDEVVESRGSRGHRFDIPGDDSQYYVMLPGGALELRDKTALIAVAERIPLAKDRGRLAQRGLGIAGALAAKQDRAKAAVAAARARTATPAPSQPAVTVTQQTSAQAPPDAASPVAAFSPWLRRASCHRPRSRKRRHPLRRPRWLPRSVAEGPAAAPQTVAPASRANSFIVRRHASVRRALQKTLRPVPSSPHVFRTTRVAGGVSGAPPRGGARAPGVKWIGVRR